LLEFLEKQFGKHLKKQTVFKNQGEDFNGMSLWRVWFCSTKYSNDKEVFQVNSSSNCGFEARNI
jgi:hypothetical protein